LPDSTKALRERQAEAIARSGGAKFAVVYNPPMVTRVAIIDDYHHAFASAEPTQRLRDVADVNLYEEPFTSQDALVEAVRDADVIIANRERTAFTADLLGRLPALRFISQTGTHFYHVDVDAATRQGILLANAPGGSSPSVTDLTIALMIDLVRRIPYTDAAMHRGEWPVELFGSVNGKVLGILGMGKIGNRVARVAQALEMDVVAWGPTLTDERAAISGVRRLELDDLMSTADFVSIHLTLSDLSRGLIGRERIALMKPTAFLINTARAAITDETALIEALQARHIAGSGSSMKTSRAAPATPHAGWTTYDSYGPWIEMTVENVLSYIDGNPIRVHNPAALARQ
jgi:phosphoglycerate dehydrogenase-like enzyme